MLKIAEIKTTGINLKEEFRSERKTARELATKFQFPLYIPNEFISSHELTCKDGIFQHTSGKLADGKYIFIRALNGKLYASNIHNTNSVKHHSYLSNGKKVTSAGTMIFSEGKLEVISNESGHYKPTNEEMLEDTKHFLATSKNQELIYEDHSQNNKEQKPLFFYSATDFVNKKGKINLLTALDVIHNKKSNFYKTISTDAKTQNNLLAQSQENSGSDGDDDFDMVQNTSNYQETGAENSFSYIEKQGLFAPRAEQKTPDIINSSCCNLNYT